MDSLRSFVRHSLDDLPGPSAPPEASGSRISPPLGTPPDSSGRILPSQPDGPGVQLPPPQPEPVPSTTDGTPAACFQRNSHSFLRGDTPGVMAQYGAQLFAAQQHTHSVHPAPEQDAEGVEELVSWREESIY